MKKTFFYLILTTLFFACSESGSKKIDHNYFDKLTSGNGTWSLPAGAAYNYRVKCSSNNFSQYYSMLIPEFIFHKDSTLTIPSMFNQQGNSRLRFENSAFYAEFTYNYESYTMYGQLDSGYFKPNNDTLFAYVYINAVADSGAWKDCNFIPITPDTMAFTSKKD